MKLHTTDVTKGGRTTSLTYRANFSTIFCSGGGTGGGGGGGGGGRRGIYPPGQNCYSLLKRHITT